MKSYEVRLKRFGGWSTIDSLDTPATREEYLALLDPKADAALIREVMEADDFETVEI